ncbi:ribonuclease H-like domain-containing protein, partial [Gaertneriomyces semiglobifer]
PEYRSALDAAVKDIVGASNWIPANEVDYLKAANEEFADFIDNAGDKCLSMINSLVAMFDVNATLRKRDTLFEDKDDLVDGFDNIVDVVDGLLEKADICLDELSGKLTTGSSTNDKSKSSLSRKKVYNVVHAQNITRPQLAFKDKVDNSSTTPFIRKIQYKPNAKRPLDYGLPGSADISPEMSDHLRTLGITDASSSYFNLPHPYEYEIQTLEYPAEMFQRNRPDQLYASMSETPFTWIDTEEKLDQLASLLDGVTEIAIDTEAHDYRSFQGFVCLVQISTRKEDFIVDTLLLRHHMHVLNTSFTNPNIVKVFHGAESDIIWLQRDFGLYIVNLFDTYHASHLLEMSHHSLSFLLKYYCDVEADKQYQLADWRIRPLPVEMLHYARSDTHYLLYIYDRMRNELLTNSNETGNLLRATLERSAETSLQRYEKDLYDSENGAGPMGWSNAIRKFGGANSPTHLSVFKAIHMWRDHIAREEDESLRYVLPNHMLYTLSVKQPVTQQGVLACCSPVPPLVRLYASDLALLIEEA